MEYIRKDNVICLRLCKGEEIISSIRELCFKENILTASVSGIGATNRAVIGVLVTGTKNYVVRELKEDMEIASLTGNITRQQDVPYLHLHIALGGLNGAYCGHLNSATVSATAEIFVTVYDMKVGRFFDSDTGLNLFSF